MKKLYVCGGCFWGTERAFQLLKGVISTEVGYANGHQENPSYQQVCQGNTGHKECVMLEYDPKIISLKTLLEAFFISIHPEQADGQGNDIGSQYLTAILYTDEEDREFIQAYFDEEKKKHISFHVGLEKLYSFYPAEAYHQDYLLHNPNGYCHVRSEQFEKIIQLQKEEKHD